LSGFGLVTQDNAPSFVPFNTTVAPFANDQFGISFYYYLMQLILTHFGREPDPQLDTAAFRRH
jgi:hypothetical protein